MKIEIVKREKLKIIGMKIRTTALSKEIPKLWNDFIKRVPEIDNITGDEVSVGICYAEEHDEKQHFTYLAGMIVINDDAVPAGMSYLELPEQLVAVFTHKGPIDKLAETYSMIFDEWFQESEYEPIDAAELEWYDSRFEYGEDDSELDIHIPIKRVEGSAASIFSLIGDEDEDI